jgi:hypothetical protein
MICQKLLVVGRENIYDSLQNETCRPMLLAEKLLNSLEANDSGCNKMKVYTKTLWNYIRFM